MFRCIARFEFSFFFFLSSSPFILPHLDRIKTIIDEVNFLSTSCNYTRSFSRFFSLVFYLVKRWNTKNDLNNTKKKMREVWLWNLFFHFHSIRCSIQVFNFYSVGVGSLGLMRLHIGGAFIRCVNERLGRANAMQRRVRQPNGNQ